MWADIALATVLCAAGLVFAAHFPLCERRAGLIAASAIACDNAFYLLAWSPIAPHKLIHCKATALWSISALLAGGIIAEVSVRYWWGRLLAITYIVTIWTYVLEARGVAFGPVSMLTDYTNYLQIAVLAAVGGRGVRDKFISRFDRNRNGLDAHQSVS